MPSYEYRCPEPTCGRVIVIDRKIADRDNPVRCKHGKTDVEPVDMQRGVGCRGFLLKGSGWYKDGYGSTKPA